MQKIINEEEFPIRNREELNFLVKYIKDITDIENYKLPTIKLEVYGDYTKDTGFKTLDITFNKLFLHPNREEDIYNITKTYTYWSYLQESKDTLYYSRDNGESSHQIISQEYMMFYDEEEILTPFQFSKAMVIAYYKKIERSIQNANTLELFDIINSGTSVLEFNKDGKIKSIIPTKMHIGLSKYQDQYKKLMESTLKCLIKPHYICWNKDNLMHMGETQGNYVTIPTNLLTLLIKYQDKLEEFKGWEKEVTLKHKKLIEQEPTLIELLHSKCGGSLKTMFSYSHLSDIYQIEKFNYKKQNQNVTMIYMQIQDVTQEFIDNYTWEAYNVYDIKYFTIEENIKLPSNVCIKKENRTVFNTENIYDVPNEHVYKTLPTEVEWSKDNINEFKKEYLKTYPELKKNAEIKKWIKSCI